MEIPVARPFNSSTGSEQRRFGPAANPFLGDTEGKTTSRKPFDARAAALSLGGTKGLTNATGVNRAGFTFSAGQGVGRLLDIVV